MNRVAALLIAFLLIGCGGGAANTPPQPLLSPSIDLVGTYIPVGYYRDGVYLGASTGEMEIGATRIRVSINPYPPPWTNGTYDYTLNSSLSGDYIKTTANGVRMYFVYIVTDGSMVFKAWIRIDNVMYETFWEKVSNHETVG